MEKEQENAASSLKAMPLLWLSLALLGGIILASRLTLPTWAWLSLAGTTLLFAWLPRLIRRRAIHPLPSPFTPPLPFFVLIVTFFLGAFRYQAAQPQLEPGQIAWYNDLQTKLIIEGIVIEPPDRRDHYTNLRLQVERLRPFGDPRFLPVQGLLLVRLPPAETWRYGDRLRLEGQLTTPPEWEQFSYRDYLARQGIHSYMSEARATLLKHGQGNQFLAIVYDLKDRLLAAIYRLFPDPEASLLAGILLGVDNQIPQEVNQAFRDTGTSHLIAISGFNIAIIAGVFAFVFTRLLGKRRGALAAGLGIAFYTFLVGASPAVVRAALFGGLTLLGRQLGRRQTGLNSLAFVAALMALFDPFVLWDIGFQLSFAATLGLVLYTAPFTEAFIQFTTRFLPRNRAERLAGPVGEYFLLTLAAQLTTLPVIIYHFRQISLISFAANPLVLPLQPPVMLLGGLATLLGLVYQPLGQIIAYAALPFLTLTIHIVEWLGAWPGGVLPLGAVTLPAVISFYILIFAIPFAPARWSNLRAQIPPGLAFSLLSAAALLTWRSALNAPDGMLHVTILDIGSGSAVLIQTPGGRNILIGGGESATRLSDALGRRLPPGARRLDWLVIAAPDRDGLTSLPPLLQRYPPAQVLWAGPTHGDYASRQLWEALTLARIPLIPMQPGHVLDLGQGASLQALQVGRRGAVLLLQWNRFRLLLPNGLDLAELEDLQSNAKIGPVSALLLANSGYAPLNPPAWISTLRPNLVLLSVAADDTNGLPDPETLQAVQGYPLLRTDQNGWIELVTDGQNLWVTAERPDN